jgi:hypothetical protein
MVKSMHKDKPPLLKKILKIDEQAYIRESRAAFDFIITNNAYCSIFKTGDQ